MVMVTDGSLVWITRIDDHPLSTVTGSGTIYGNNLFIGIDSNELAYAAANTNYACCSFVGSMVNVNLEGGEVQWKTYAICKNISGVGNFSGAAFVGSTPPVSGLLGLVFATTGLNYNTSLNYTNCTNSTPPQNITADCDGPNGLCNNAESIIAFNLTTGAIVWVDRLGAWTVWNMTCGPNATNVSANCPDAALTSTSFGMNPALDVWCPPSSETGVCYPALYIAQRTGVLFSINASTGIINWVNQTAPGGTIGGSTTGVAVDDNLVYISVVNDLNLNWILTNGSSICGGGWAAHHKTTGLVAWNIVNPAYYDPSGRFWNDSSNGRSKTSWGVGAPAVVNDIVLVTSADTVYVPDQGTGIPSYGSGGWVYALNKTNGGISSCIKP